MVMRTLLLATLLVCVGGSVSAQSSFDLFVSRIELDPVDPAVGFTSGGTALNVTVTVEVNGPTPSPFPSNLYLTIKQNGSSVQSFLLSSPDDYGPVPLTIALGDIVTAEIDVDANDVFPQNNILQLPIGASSGLACGDYPPQIEFFDPEDSSGQAKVILDWVGKCAAGLTKPVAFVLMFLPPFDAGVSESGTTMSTAFLQTDTSTEENSTTTGVTAGGMIEVTVGWSDPIFDVGAQATWGAEIQTDLAVGLGEAIERTYSIDFTASTLAPEPGDPASGEHAVLVQMTAFRVVKYTVTEAHLPAREGETVWIGVPTDPEVDPNQILINPIVTSMKLSEYNAFKSPAAMALGPGPHVIGFKDSYQYGGSPHDFMHIQEPLLPGDAECDPLENPLILWQTVARESTTVGSGAGVTWSQTHEEGGWVSSDETRASTMYVSGEVSGGGVTVATGVSFGTFNGRSHRSYHGFQHGYEWSIGPVISFDDSYFVTAYADLVKVTCIADPVKPWPQYLLLVDYAVPKDFMVPSLSPMGVAVLGVAVFGVGVMRLVIGARRRRG